MILSQPISFKTNIEELSELCSIVTCSLCRYLDIDRQKNLTVFCYKLLSCIDISPSVIYTGLKYIQSILANNYQCVDEYSLFTVTLLLAYKYTEDYSPPNMLQWSFVSMIPVKTLISLETKLLQHLDYSLHISAETFMLWTEECNVLCNLQQQQSLIDIYHNYYYDYSYYYYYYYHYTLNTYPTLSSHLMYDEAYQDDVCSQTQIPVISSNDIWYPFFL